MTFCKGDRVVFVGKECGRNAKLITNVSTGTVFSINGGGSVAVFWDEPMGGWEIIVDGIGYPNQGWHMSCNELKSIYEVLNEEPMIDDDFLAMLGGT